MPLKDSSFANKVEIIGRSPARASVYRRGREPPLYSVEQYNPKGVAGLLCRPQGANHNYALCHGG